MSTEKKKRRPVTIHYGEVVETVNKVIKEYRIRLTIRQIYYRLISPPFQLFGNTLSNYKTMDRILTKARERQEVDWRKIEDRARNIMGGEHLTFDTPEEYVDWVFKEVNEGYFTKSYWEKQPTYVEVWVEKDALAGLFNDAARPFRIVLFPSRGYSSFTKVAEAVSRFPNGKPIKILHFADHDPSGIDMTRDLETRLRDYGAEDFEIKRIALTIEQVRELGLASNPTKSADSRSPKYVAEFGNECWELDAVPPDTLQEWVRKAIQDEIDRDAWDETEEEIADEKDRITKALKKSLPSIQRLAKKVQRAL